MRLPAKRNRRRYTLWEEYSNDTDAKKKIRGAGVRSLAGGCHAAGSPAVRRRHHSRHLRRMGRRSGHQPPFPRPPVRPNGSFRGLPQKANSLQPAKYRKAIAELPTPGLKVRDDGDKIVLENVSKTAIVPALPDDPKRDRNPETETRKLPATDQDRPLSQAANDARRILHADGTLYGNEDDPDFILRQIASLESGAGKAGFLHQGLTPDLKGGVEHDVTFDDATGTVLKFTKPDKAAYAVNFDLGTPKMASATPLDYLERLEIQNEIFGDNLRFVGVATADDGRRIVTRQDVVTGRPARWEEIVRMMTDLGFTKLRHNHGVGYEDSYAFVRDDAAVFDMRPANVFVTEDGVIVPVDCIPVRLPPGKRAFFDK
jgi:hypothetical protein